MADPTDGLKPTPEALAAVAASRSAAASAVPAPEKDKPEVVQIEPGAFAKPGNTAEFVGYLGDTKGVKVTVKTN